MTSVVNDYAITVLVHESAKILRLDEKRFVPNQFCQISLGGKSQTTTKRLASVNAAYDEHALFYLTETSESDLDSHLVEFAIYHSSNFGFLEELVGKAVISLGWVRKLSGQTVAKLWTKILSLEAPNRKAGFICVSVSLAKVNSTRTQKMSIPNISNFEEKGLNQMLSLSMHSPEHFANFPHLTLEARHGVCACAVPVETAGPWHVLLRFPHVSLDPYIRLLLYTGHELLSVFVIEIANFGLRWVNFYGEANPPVQESAVTAMRSILLPLKSSSKVSLPWSSTPSSLLDPPIYLGRILSRLTSQVTAQLVSPSMIIGNNHQLEHFEAPVPQKFSLCVDIFYACSSLGDIGPIQIEVALGPHSIFSKVAHWDKETFMYSWKSCQSLETFRIFENNPSDGYNVLLYIIHHPSKERVAYFRSPTIFLNAVEQRWFPLISCKTKLDCFSLLAVFQAFISSSSNHKSEIAATTYSDARSTVILKEALENEPYELRCYIEQAIHLPQEEKGFEEEDVCIKVYCAGQSAKTAPAKSRAPTFSELLILKFKSLPSKPQLLPVLMIDAIGSKSSSVLGRAFFPLTEAPDVWMSMSQWFTLSDSKNPIRYRGSVLCAFELLDSSSYASIPRSLKFPTKKFDLYFCLWGLRFLYPFPYKRIPKLTIRISHSPSFRKFIPLPFSGGGRFFSYFFLLTFKDCNFIPSDFHIASYIQVQIEKGNFEAYIPITPELPHLENDERNFAISTFKPKYGTIDDIEVQQSLAQTLGLRGQTKDSKQATELSTNLKMIKESQFNLEVLDTFEVQGVGNSNSSTNFFDEDFYNKKGVEKESSSAKWTASRDLRPIHLEKILDVYPDNKFSAFKTAPMYRNSKVSGFANYVLETDLELYKKKLKQIWDLSPVLIVRVYILNIVKAPPLTSIGAKRFLVVENSPYAKEGGKFYHKEMLISLSSRTICVNKCFELQAVLPENGLLGISLWEENGSQSKVLIGSTYLQLGIRWFNPKYQEWVANHCVPTEERWLIAPDRKKQFARIQLWLDIFEQKDLPSHPRPLALPNPNPECFQLSLVAWRLNRWREAPSVPVSLFLTASYFHNSSSTAAVAFSFLQAEEETQSSELDANSITGAATFNWRFVFHVMLPARFPKLQLRLYERRHLLSSGELLGELGLDLSNDFVVAKQQRDCSMQRHWVGLLPTNEKETETSANYQLEIEYRVLPIAAAPLQGKGRSEPNVETFLPTPDNVHSLLSGWGETARHLGVAVENAVLGTAKWTLGIGLTALVCMTILFLIVLFKR